MYRSIADFLESWKYESAITQKLLDNLTDASLGQRITNETRSLGELAWHLAGALRAIPGEAGLEVTGPAHGEPVPSSADAIREAYRTAAASFADNLPLHWNDAMLTDMVSMWGTPWSYGTVLLETLLHQAHHRGQITVLMRQAGVPIIGVYGPTLEGM